MKKVFEKLSSHEVGFFKSHLEAHGIPTELRNGSMIGSMSLELLFVELWVLDDGDYDRAVALLEEYRKNSRTEVEGTWQCASCGAEVPENFEQCWKCQTVRPEATL